jgi:hypothetical protein
MRPRSFLSPAKGRREAMICHNHQGDRKGMTANFVQYRPRLQLPNGKPILAASREARSQMDSDQVSAIVKS